MVRLSPAGTVVLPPAHDTSTASASVFVTVNQYVVTSPVTVTVLHCATTSKFGSQSTVISTSGMATPLMATVKVCTPSVRSPMVTVSVPPGATT